jgi:hypothetical protein
VGTLKANGKINDSWIDHDGPDIDKIYGQIITETYRYNLAGDGKINEPSIAGASV